MDIEKASFICSNTDWKKCPKPSIPEYAFIGRSNVGKSSLINSLTNSKKLAKTSAIVVGSILLNAFFKKNKKKPHVVA